MGSRRAFVSNQQSGRASPLSANSRSLVRCSPSADWEPNGSERCQVFAPQAATLS